MIAVFGDIHGSINTLKKLFYKLTDKYSIHRFVFLGDLIDRGLHSKEVVEFLMDKKDKYSMTFLKGNHEDLLINAIENENRYLDFAWHERVGLSTVASFMRISLEEAKGKSISDIIPYFSSYIDFFKNFQEYCIISTKKHNFLLSHAGPAFFDLPHDRQYEKCTLEEKNRHYPYIWHTNTRTFKEKYYDYIIIHGHEAIVNRISSQEDLDTVTPLIHKDKKGEIISINIDTGCFYGGKLSAVVIDDNGDFTFEWEKWDE